MQTASDMRSILRVEQLGKMYKIAPARARYETLGDTVSTLLKRTLFRQSPSELKQFWALRNVDLDVRPGELVGIIGRNGSGKTTLLKLISRVTVPTEGRIEAHGRIASLLGLGTGFHPELTGRENIFLNGAILGMSRAEVRRQFDEIVAFSEIETFLDTPVKFYSNGMYMRLAFAVAAHLQPEILLVDEVLAVGDAAFQRKCLAKMNDIAEVGRTVLFVSHNLGVVSRLCKRCIVIKEGHIVFSGTPADAIAFYERDLLATAGSSREPHVLFEAEGEPKESPSVIKIEMLDSQRRSKATLATWDEVVFRIWFQSNEAIRNTGVELQINTIEGQRLVCLSTRPDNTVQMDFAPGVDYVDCHIPRFPLSAGEFTIGVGLAIPGMKWLWLREELAQLRVLENDVYGSGMSPVTGRAQIAFDHSWSTSTQRRNSASGDASND